MIKIKAEGDYTPVDKWGIIYAPNCSSR